MKKLNWNDCVKVKLTDHGKDIYFHQYDNLIEEGLHIEREYPKVDEDGFSEFQLWPFMNLYGPYINMAMPVVAEGICFYIDEVDLEDV